MSISHCQHANERPNFCPCDVLCICRMTTCQLFNLPVRCSAHGATFCEPCGEQGRVENAQRWINRVVFSHGLDEPVQARAAAVSVEARCAAAHREEIAYAAWAAALVTVLVCLGQLAAERAPPSRSEWFKNLEVD